VGDFNRDGELDLAVANYGSNNISVLLGNGDGTFQAPVDYGAGSAPASVAVGDFNRDGKLDLAVANFDGNNISVLLGNGDGTFQTAVDYGLVSRPEWVAVGDFNGDGKLDLAVAVTGYWSGSVLNPGTIAVLLSNGSGTFQQAVYYGVGLGETPASVAVGDFNGDGRLDLAVANSYCSPPSPCVAVLLGNGDGTFQTAVNYDAGNQPDWVAVGDFNRDGKLDLAVANPSSQNVSVLLGNGDGTFQTAVNYSIPADAFSVAIADLNGDGKLDLAVGSGCPCGAPGSVSVLLGNGDGTFQSGVNYGAGSYPNSVVVGDFNGNGRLDLAVADYGSTTVSVLLQIPAVSLSEASLTFADHVIGTSSPAQTVTLINGGLPLTISGIVVTGTNATDFSQHNTCDSGLPVGAKCTITVTFTPTQTGPRTASVTHYRRRGRKPTTDRLEWHGSGLRAERHPVSREPDFCDSASEYDQHGEDGHAEQLRHRGAQYHQHQVHRCRSRRFRSDQHLWKLGGRGHELHD
jgi:hypothetical protein